MTKGLAFPKPLLLEPRSRNFATVMASSGESAPMIPESIVKIENVRRVIANVQRGMIRLTRTLDRNNTDHTSLRALLSNLSTALRDIDKIDVSAYNLLIDGNKDLKEELHVSKNLYLSLQEKMKQGMANEDAEKENALRWETKANEEMQWRKIYAEL